MNFTEFASMLYPIFAVAAVALIPITVGVLVGTVLRLSNAHNDARERALEASIARHPAGKKLGRGHHAAESRPANDPTDPRTNR